MDNKKEINWENIKAYVQGKVRYKLYYSKYFKWLIPKHISEQIAFRLFIMDQDCYFLGSCQLCGCETPALQMANKACEKPCYPEMMNKEDWAYFKYFNKDFKKSSL